MNELCCRRQVTNEEAAAFAVEQGALYVEASAKTAAGVEEAFMRTVAVAWDRAAKGQLVLRDADRASAVGLRASKNVPRQEKSSCC